MVPGSTLMYGSSLISATFRPRASSRQPIEDAARPFPKLETTPPVTKIYFGIAYSLFLSALPSSLLLLPLRSLPSAYCLLPTALPPLPVHRLFPVPHQSDLP